jgi:hypothetical protein
MEEPMRKAISVAYILTALAVPAFAADALLGSAPKGTICYSNNLVVAGESNALINCKGLGKFTSIAEIYERGYRVVNTGFLPDPRPGVPPLTSTLYLIVEERK